MEMAFAFYRHKNFRKRTHCLCALLIVIIYLVLNHSSSNEGSQNSPNSNSKWPDLKDTSLEQNCSLPIGSLGPLTELGIETTPKRRQILLLAYHRGGSTFLGEIFKAYPGAFLHFEPLLLVTGNEQVRSAKEIIAALHLLQKLYKCRFGTRIRMNRNWPRSCLWYLEFNLPTLAGCTNPAHFCYSPAVLDALCASHVVQVTKVLRLRLDNAKYLLKKLPDLRIVFLTRDPRGLYNSRRKWKWCKAIQSCIEPDTFCEDIRKDLAEADKLREQFPNRIIEVRYHDIAMDTENQVAKLLDFLELPRSTAVDEFIRTHTTTSKEGKESDSLLTTFRDSKNRPFLWQKQLSDKDIARVEASCTDVIQHLGFNLTILK